MLQAQVSTHRAASPNSSTRTSRPFSATSSRHRELACVALCCSSLFSAEALAPTGEPVLDGVRSRLHARVERACSEASQRCAEADAKLAQNEEGQHTTTMVVGRVKALHMREDCLTPEGTLVSSLSRCGSVLGLTLSRLRTPPRRCQSRAWAASPTAAAPRECSGHGPATPLTAPSRSGFDLSRPKWEETQNTPEVQAALKEERWGNSTSKVAESWP